MLETPKTLLVTHTTNRTVYNFLFFPNFLHLTFSDIMDSIAIETTFIYLLYLYI